MKYVYVVMCGCIGDEHVDTICSSEAKAKERVKEINSTHFGRSTEPYYERWEVK